MQPQLKIVPTLEKLTSKSFPVVSFIKGLSFTLVDLSDAPEMLAGLLDGPTPDAALDEGWGGGSVGCLFFKGLEMDEVEGEPAIRNLQARFFAQGREQQASSTAASALSCYLALNTQFISTTTNKDDVDAALAEQTESMKLSGKAVRKVFGIQTGAEVGRRCTIAVEVDIEVDDAGKSTVKSVILSGRANFGMRGELIPT